MPEVPAVLETENSLIKVYEDAWERVVAQQQALVDDPLKAARRARLAEMRAVIEDTMEEVSASSRAWIEQRLPQLYATGGTVGAGATGVGEFLWTTISQEAVEELAFNLMGDVLKATKHVNDTTKGLIRAIARSEGLQKLIEGRTAVQAGREMSKLIAKEGIAAITYSNGAKHGLDSYGEMLARTTTAKAYNIGTLNGAAQNGCQFWEVFDGPDCGWSSHNSGELASGMIVTREEALSYPISHPRCRRAFGPRPDLTGPASAGEGKGQVTPEQLAAQRAQDAERAAKQARRSARNQQQKATRDGRSPKNRVEKRAAKLGSRTSPQPAKPTWVAEEATGAPKGMGSALPPDQDQVWARYAGQSYETNSALRRGEMPLEAEVLDQVFKSSRTPEAMTAYRMIDDEKLYNRINRRKPDGTVNLRDDAYLSTTLDKNVVADFSREEFPVRLDIDVAQNTPAFYVGDRYESRAIMMDQKEMVLPRGAQLRVYGHVKMPDGTIVAKAYIDGFAPLAR